MSKKMSSTILNKDILRNPNNWYIPRWNELGFAAKTLVTRKEQTAYRNKVDGKVINSLFDETTMRNIAQGYDPLKQYLVKKVPKLNVGSLGVRAWFKFNEVPEELKGVSFINPVYADRNLMQYVLHQGLDYNSSPHLRNKQEVRCVYDGTVIKISYDNTSGNYIIMQHSVNDYTFYTAYMHLSAPTVPIGSSYKQGEIIGVVGNTGSARGLYSTHLHFEIRDKSYTGYLDPIAVIGIDNINKQ